MTECIGFTLITVTTNEYVQGGEYYHQCVYHYPLRPSMPIPHTHKPDIGAVSQHIDDADYSLLFNYRRVALAKQGDYRFGRVRPSICLSVDALTAETFDSINPSCKSSLTAHFARMREVTLIPRHFHSLDIRCEDEAKLKVKMNHTA